jgi:signal transduction histidine kinase
VRWYGSLYFRVAASIVTFAGGLLLLQALLFMRAQERMPLGNRPPNTVAAIVAADLQAALAENGAADLDRYLKTQYARTQPVYLVLADGSTASNRTEPLAADMRRYVEDLLSGAGVRGARPVEPKVLVPFVTAPVQVGGLLKGMVVLPPAATRDPFRTLQALVSPAGTAVLIALIVLAAAFIVEPARRRLRRLEDVSLRFGAGDLSARVPVNGRDEVTAVGAAFNRMAEEIAARDEALRTSDRLRRQMLADVSHELKTPLTSMVAYVETLRDQGIALDTETRTRYLDTLKRETVRLDRLVRDLLDLARLENGVSDLEPRVFATARVFEHVQHRHRLELDERRIASRIDIAPTVDQMVADPDRIEQVVENLFANATPSGSARGPAD